MEDVRSVRSDYRRYSSEIQSNRQNQRADVRSYQLELKTSQTPTPNHSFQYGRFRTRSYDRNDCSIRNRSFDRSDCSKGNRSLRLDGQDYSYIEDQSVIIEFDNMTSPHIDIYDDTEVNPPSYLNVAPIDEDTVSRRGYSLKRSKSVCDLSAAQPVSKQEDKVSKVVRNKTILGSFPLFYKLSQSLSSLNTSTTTTHNNTVCCTSPRNR